MDNRPADTVPSTLGRPSPAERAVESERPVEAERAVHLDAETDPNVVPGASRLARVGLARYLQLQRAHVHLRLTLAQLCVRLIPFGSFSAVRAILYRAGGVGIGSGVRFAGPLTLWGTGDIAARLRVGARTFINSPAHIELNAPVQIGARCAIGHHLVIVTSNHVLGPAEQRAGAVYHRPVRIGDGVWIGAQVMILPGVTIGDGAFVTAGVVVTRDVAPNTQVSGARGEVVRLLPDQPAVGGVLPSPLDAR